MGKRDIRSISDRLERAAIRFLKPISQRLSGSGADREYVFIAGMQRSGTNMVMEVLERSFLTDVYHETDPRAFDDYSMRERAVIHQLAGRSRAPYFIIKALLELDQLRSLMDEFTPAKTVWILRNVNDTVNSATASFSDFSARLGRMQTDRMSDGWHGRGMSDETYAYIKSLYHPDINEASAAAMMWYYRNILFFEQGLDKDPRVLLTRYEKLVTQPQEEFARIFAFLGIPYSPWVSHRVFASSIRSRPAPPIDAEIFALCRGLSERFEALSETSHRGN